MNYISEVETAKLVRKELKTSFPGIKFSVIVSKYSMGSSITVYWKGEPTRDDVRTKVGHFQGSSFDPMQDLKFSNGQPYANDYIMFQRS